MSLCVCKCLNVTLESDRIEDLTDIRKLELSTAEQREVFFNEKLICCPVSSLRQEIVQMALVKQRCLEHWTIHSCLACGQPTHALAHDKPHLAVIPKSIQSTLERVNSLKRSSNYSPVFKLVVPEVSCEVDGSAGEAGGAGSLSSQLARTLQDQLEAVEEMVRQFRDQKYAEYEAYREKAKRHHRILSSIAVRVGAGDGNGGAAPLPPLQRRRLSSVKDAKKFALVEPKTARSVPAEEDSLEAEDLFELEHDHHMISDQHYDSDESDSSEEMVVPRRAARPELARSLPVPVPARHAEPDDTTESCDIAASIRALARSARGDTFELPRPRCEQA